MGSEQVIRVTMFKIPSKTDQETLLKNYTILSQTQAKDGKPYILSLEAGSAVDDPRAQGYTIVAKSVFKSMDDLKYYDTECAAHQVLKAGNKKLGIDGFMTVFFSPTVVAGAV
ncbi:stress responsive a b barrel domain-containing protein [Phlyctema vagabunda]|uniref:Stress responsive a b barrel domain-containing protein n=1 Tax=Phlyctema vagabunda TaxID=108571 RepID=A0ABR4PG14_9HELO